MGFRETYSGELGRRVATSQHPTLRKCPQHCSRRDEAGEKTNNLRSENIKLRASFTSLSGANDQRYAYVVGWKIGGREGSGSGRLSASLTSRGTSLPSRFALALGSLGASALPHSHSQKLSARGREPNDAQIFAIVHSGWSGPRDTPDMAL